MLDVSDELGLNWSWFDQKDTSYMTIGLIGYQQMSTASASHAFVAL